MKTTAAPRSTPTSTAGLNTSKMRDSRATPASESASNTEVEYEPNNAVAASTAVAIAMPLVIALVVLPTASSSVRICAPAGLTSPDISAMPWALSETGPKVSMATITPTVVSRPQPASATAKSEIVSEPEPRRNAPNTAAPITSVVYTADSKPTDRPDRMTVAAPVSDVLPTSFTGLYSVPVK